MSEKSRTEQAHIRFHLQPQLHGREEKKIDEFRSFNGQQIREQAKNPQQTEWLRQKSTAYRRAHLIFLFPALIPAVLALFGLEEKKKNSKRMPSRYVSNSCQ